MLGIKGIEEMSLIIFGNICFHGRSKKGSFSHINFIFSRIVSSLDIETVMHLNLEHGKFILLNTEVGHLNIQTMEMDSLDRLRDIVRKFTFTDPGNCNVIGECAALMELTIKLVEFNEGTTIVNKLLPDS